MAYGEDNALIDRTLHQKGNKEVPDRMHPLLSKYHNLLMMMVNDDINNDNNNNHDRPSVQINIHLEGKLDGHGQSLISATQTLFAHLIGFSAGQAPGQSSQESTHYP